MAAILNPMMFKLPFDGCGNLSRNFSQTEQDIFVLSCLDGKRRGRYIDLGCERPIEINNTYLLESEFDWKGLSVDFEPTFVEAHSKERKNDTLLHDATTIDWDWVTNKYKTEHFDYLSLDLDPASTTYNALLNIPLDRVSFSVVTYEHDFYRFGDEWRAKSREHFKNNGYVLLCSDVKSGDCIYEDWYYNPRYVESERVIPLQSHSMSGPQIVYR